MPLIYTCWTNEAEQITISWITGPRALIRLALIYNSWRLFHLLPITVLALFWGFGLQASVVQKLFLPPMWCIFSGGVNTPQHKKFWKICCNRVLFGPGILFEVVVIHQSWEMSVGHSMLTWSLGDQSLCAVGWFPLTYTLATCPLQELRSLVSAGDLVGCPQIRYSILHQMGCFSQWLKRSRCMNNLNCFYFKPAAWLVSWLSLTLIHYYILDQEVWGAATL